MLSQTWSMDLNITVITPTQQSRLYMRTFRKPLKPRIQFIAIIIV